jgi:MFS family permease
MIKDKVFYGWIVVAASLVITSTFIGIRFSFGVFFKSLEAEFELGRAATSSIFSVYMICYATAAFVTGWALDRYGPKLVVLSMGLLTTFSLVITSQITALWQLYLTYSILLAFGGGGIVPVLMSTISRWFVKKRGFALGIASTGMGLGPLIMAPVATYLISNLSWRGSYTVVGIFTLFVVISLSMLLRKSPSDIGALPDGVIKEIGDVKKPSEVDGLSVTSISFKEAVGTKNLWLLLASGFLWASNLNLVMIHVVPHAIDMGISTMQASTILSVLSGTSILARMLVGRISDTVGRRLPAIATALLGAGALAWLLWADALWMFYLFAVACGIAWGGVSVTVWSLVGDIFHGRNLGVIVGTVEFGFAAGSAIGPAVGGVLFDVTGNYTLAFMIGAATLILLSLFISRVKTEKGGL